MLDSRQRENYIENNQKRSGSEWIPEKNSLVVDVFVNWHSYLIQFFSRKQQRIDEKQYIFLV